MSIEALIQAHTEALLANTEAVKLLTVSLAGRTPAKSEEKPKQTVNEPVVIVNEEKVLKGAKEAAKVAGKTSADEDKKPAPEDDIPDFDAVPYETVRALVLKLAGAGKREEIKALNAKHGIANLKVLLDKEDDFSTVNDQAKLEAVYADLQALEG